MPNYPSLSELLAAYKDNGLGDAINAGVAGYNTGSDRADADLKRKQDFQNKLTELGIQGKKAEADTLEAATKKRHQDASEIPANTTGVDSLAPLKDRPVDISALNAKTKSESKPPMRPQYVGPALGPDGKPTGQGMIFNPDSASFSQVPLPASGVGPKNTPNAPASMVADEGSIANQSGMVDQMEAMLKTMPAGGIMEGAKGMASHIPLIGASMAPQEKAYNSLAPAVATAVYRAQTGDTRLSDQDAAQRAYPLLPKLDEPPEVQQHKLAVIRQLFANRASTVQQQQATVRNLPGSSISAPAPVNGGDIEAKKAALKAKLGI